MAGEEQDMNRTFREEMSRPYTMKSCYYSKTGPELELPRETQVGRPKHTWRRNIESEDASIKGGRNELE